MRQKQVSSSSYVISEQANVPAEDYDVVLIGGGVAGYVAAIKAGQEGMKVRKLL
jgi:heterodisulfide reductase subunit A-like polyferredoxin